MACAQCGLITYTTRFCRCTILTWSRHVHTSFCLLEGIQKPNGIYCLLMSDWHQSSFSSCIATWGANKIEKGSISEVTLLYNYLHLSGWLGNLIVSRPALGACLQRMCNTLTRDNCPARNIFSCAWHSWHRFHRRQAARKLSSTAPFVTRSGAPNPVIATTALLLENKPLADKVPKFKWKLKHWKGLALGRLWDLPSRDDGVSSDKEDGKESVRVSAEDGGTN